MSLLRRAAAVLLHNPACSKSRAALGLLQQSGATFDTREYLQEPLSRAELEELQARLGQPTRWIRRGETAWVERFGDADAAPSDAACLTALAEAPALLERPIFVHGAFATVGRPPELVLALVGELPPTAAAPSFAVCQLDEHGEHEASASYSIVSEPS